MDAKIFLLINLLCLPLKHLSVNSNFGNRIHPISGKVCFHAGVDLAARSDTVFAIADGIVEATGFDSHFGRFIKIGHNTLKSTYGHLSIIGVSPNDSVFCGQPIGITGATGRVTGEHLHFAISFKKHSIDPLAFLCGWYNKQQFMKEQDHEKDLESGDR